MTITPLDAPLHDLPGQPAGVPWPTEAWPTGPAPAAVDLPGRFDELFGDTATYGTTYASVVVQHGRLLGERYAGELTHWDRDPEPVEATTKLLSWSMAKSIVHAAAGILAREGRLAVRAPAAIGAWQHEAEDPRRHITLQQLFEMRDGLDFLEEYTVEGRSDVVTMLFGAGQHDMAAYAAGRSLAHEPGTVYNYSSGTSVLLARVLGDVVGGGEDGMRSFLRTELFDRIGMRSAEPRFDAAGTFIGSSYVYAAARDFARFGLLYLRDGVWDGARILPEGWVDHGRRPRSYDEDDDRYYGAHWWSTGDDLGSFFANGYEGQFVLCVPDLDLVVVRLGKTVDDQKAALRRWRDEIRDAFRDA